MFNVSETPTGDLNMGQRHGSFPGDRKYPSHAPYQQPEADDQLLTSRRPPPPALTLRVHCFGVSRAVHSLGAFSNPTRIAHPSHTTALTRSTNDHSASSSSARAGGCIHTD